MMRVGIAFAKLRHFVGGKVKSSFPNVYDDIFYYYFYLKYKRRSKTKPENYASVISRDYMKCTGKSIDIDNPRSYSEKIQFLKLYDDNSLRSMLTDKVQVREWIKEKIGERYLMPVFGIYDSVDEIDFDNLPEKYVIKTNHGSGWNIIVKNKSEADISHIKKQLRRWMKLDYAFWTEYEIHYSPIKPKIIVENYMSDSRGELNDYKFLCFDGECKYFWMDFDRNTNHKRNVYDMEWNLQPWNQWTYGNYTGTVTKPINFEEMVHVVNVLCKGFRHVRVDLYNVDGKVYFGEMTFTNGSGFEGINPEEYDQKLGELISLEGLKNK